MPNRSTRRHLASERALHLPMSAGYLDAVSLPRASRSVKIAHNEKKPARQAGEEEASGMGQLEAQ